MFGRKTKTTLKFITKESPVFAEVMSPRTHDWPDWWRNLKEQNMSTMKSCPGFVDLLRETISVPLWRDYEIKYTDKIEYIEVPGVTTPEYGAEFFEYHPNEQYGNNFSNYIHVKLKTPWITRCNDNTRFLMSDAVWHRQNFESFRVLTGQLEFRYQHGSHVNIFIPKSTTQKTLVLTAGTPICYLTPLTDRPVEIEILQETPTQWYNYLTSPISFRGSYDKLKKLARKR